MEAFKSKIVQVANGSASMLSPVSFAGKLNEAKLEELLVANPELAGEQLLVLGAQLAEFAEDKDRLDVLAVDRQGEIVLLELKVDGVFRLTDLQALAAE
jgi:RecB family endonuclease NucS